MHSQSDFGYSLPQIERRDFAFCMSKVWQCRMLAITSHAAGKVTQRDQMWRFAFEWLAAARERPARERAAQIGERKFHSAKMGRELNLDPKECERWMSRRGITTLAGLMESYAGLTAGAAVKLAAREIAAFTASKIARAP